jgi:tetratricopeptide (TPR) repeat protein
MADKRQQGEFPSIDIENLIKHVAAIFGLIAGAVGLVYAIGFAIVNISLLSYGVYEVALVRTRYVSAGVAFLVLVTILAVLAIATRIFTTKVLGRFGKSPTVVLMTSIVILFILSFLLAWLSLGWRSEVFREAWKAFRPAFEATREFGLLEGYEELEKNVTVRLTIWCFLVSALFLFVISDKPRFLKKFVGYFSPVVSTKSDADQSDNTTETSSDDSRPEAQRDGEGSDNDSESNPIRRAVERHLRWPIVAMLLVMLLYFYGLKAYATFPAALGGDLPIVVQFSATEADLAELSQLGIDVDPVRPGRTQRVALIAQTDKNFIVLVLDPILKQDVAVSLPKSHVDGIVYYPEEYYLNDEYVAEKYTQDGWVLLEQGNPDIDAAIDAFEKAKRRIPNYVPALLGLGKAYKDKGEQDEAKAWYDEAKRYICDYLDIETVSALGDAYVDLKKYGLAEEVYQGALPPENQENVTGNIGCLDNKVLSDVQSKALIHYELAQTYTLWQQYSKVADELRKAIELDETAQEKIDYRQKAKIDPVFDKDNLRLDTEFLETIFASVNDAVTWYGAEGDRLRDENELEAAVMQYTWAISLTLQLKDYDSLEEARLRFRLAGVDLLLWDGANTEVKASYQKEAIAQYKKSVDLAPDKPAYRTGLADAYRQIDDLDKAITTYLEVISPTTNSDYANPEYVPAWIGLGEAYLRREQDQDSQWANESFAQALKLQPENGQAYYGCARAEASLGNIPAATKCLRRAINLDANLIERAKKEPVFDQISDLSEIVSATQSFQDGNRLASEGNLEEALEKYKDAIAKDDKNAVYYASLGDIYFMLQRLSEAETEFKNAIDLAPENDSYHYRLAGVYYDQGKFDSAIKEYERALAINDENPTYHSGLGDAYRQMGMLDKAAEVYEQAIRLDQSNASYRARLADIYYRQGKQEDALRKYLEAIRLDEENYMYHYGLAQVYYARDEPQEAIQSYLAAIERNPEYGEAYCGLGQAYQKSKQPQDAIDAFKQCRAVSQDEGLIQQAEEALAELEAQ